MAHMTKQSKTSIWVFISSIITGFYSSHAISNKLALVWFAVGVLGIMVRSDDYGVASCIRSTGINGKHYEALLHFFRAFSWTLSGIRQKWASTVKQNTSGYTVNGHHVMLIDHTKKSKEAFYTPGVMKLVQESETQSKPEYVFGCLFGGVSYLVNRPGESKITSIPIVLILQSAIAGIRKWRCEVSEDSDSNMTVLQKDLNRAIDDLELSAKSCIDQLVVQACQCVQWMKISTYIVADRAFLSVNVLKILAENNAPDGASQVELVTRVKRTATGYLDPPERVPGTKGRSRKKGDSVKVFSLFELTNKDLDTVYNGALKGCHWVEKDIVLYGKTEHVRFLAVDLLWGLRRYQKLRFVLVTYLDVRSVLVSTDTTLSGQDIIELYAVREKIEGDFRELNQRVNAFAFRFWTLSSPKLDHFKKKGEADPLEQVTSVGERLKVTLATRAIQMYAALSCIAYGIIQILAINCEWCSDDFRWQRTKVDCLRPSVENVQQYLRVHIDQGLISNPENELGMILQSKLDYVDSKQLEKMIAFEGDPS